MRIIAGLVALILLSSCDQRPVHQRKPAEQARQPSVQHRIPELPESYLRAQERFKGLKQDECVETTVVGFRPRLNVCTMGKAGEVAHVTSGIDEGSDCGFAIMYAIGDIQAAWKTNLEVKDGWRIGDPIRLCRIDEPAKCPPGWRNPQADYRATNLRTKTSWDAPNKWHGHYCEELIE
jgi:hypothetical protein